MSRISTDRASVALRGVLDIAARVLGTLTILALVSAGAVTVAWLAWVADAGPLDTNGWAAGVVVLVALLAPPTLVLLFVGGLRDLQRLPERAQNLPADVRDHARHVREGTQRVQRARGLVGLLIGSYRLGRAILGSRDESPYAAVAIALRPAMLLAGAFAILACMAEILASLITLLILMLS